MMCEQDAWVSGLRDAGGGQDFKQKTEDEGGSAKRCKGIG